MLNRLLYNTLILLSTPYALWRLYKRYRGSGAVPWREYFGFCPPNNSKQPLLWIHSVSLGEAIAAAELAKQMQADGYRLLLTYTTPAARDWLRQHYPEALITALPLDLPAAVRLFFRRTRPVAGIVMEAEYWYNLLSVAKASGIRLMLANARLGTKNARRYRYIALLMRRMVSCFDIIAAQTERDAGRLRCYGARHVQTTGNLKFDLPAAPVVEKPRLCAKETILLAATRQGEERLFLTANKGNPNKDKAFFILAPRHPHRRDELVALCQQQQLQCQLRSEQLTPNADCQLYLADTLGEMHKWYAACDIAIIGGSFLPYGGQNPIEAMQGNGAIIVGPYMENYARLVKQAVRAGALVQVADAAAALQQARQLLSDQAACANMKAAAKQFYQKCGGALEQHLILLQRLLAVREATDGR